MNTDTQPTDEPSPTRRYHERPKVAARLNSRRTLLTNLIDRQGRHRPTIRYIVKMLKNAGCKTSFGTTHRDMVALGLIRR